MLEPIDNTELHRDYLSPNKKNAKSGIKLG